MNTANLQLSGLYAAVAALTEALRAKGLLDEAEIAAALDRAEEQTASDTERLMELSESNKDAVLFPIRYLRIANWLNSGGRDLSFSEIAALVGQMKDGHERPRAERST